MHTISIVFLWAGIITGIFTILYSESIDFYIKKTTVTLRDYWADTEPSNRAREYTLEALSKYNGEDRGRLYLAFMGTVFDVSTGYRHYGPGMSYHYFIGKDGTRAFVTGNFTDDSEDKDHISDLNCKDLLVLWNWRAMLCKKYKKIGYLIGRYYEQGGMETEYYTRCIAKINLCEESRKNTQEHTKQYPPCNVAWSAEKGTRVWCSKLSGGVTRDWTGVPRQMYTPGVKEPTCVCIQNAKGDMSMFKEYDNCANTSTTCSIRDDDKEDDEEDIE